MDRIAASTALGTAEAYVSGAIGELRQLVVNAVGALVKPKDLLTRDTLLGRSLLDLIASIRIKIERAIEEDRNSGRMVKGTFVVQIDPRLYAHQRIVQDIEGALKGSSTTRGPEQSRRQLEHSLVDEEDSQSAVYRSLTEYLDFCRTKTTKQVVVKTVQSHGVLSDQDREMRALATQFKGCFSLFFQFFCMIPIASNTSKIYTSKYTYPVFSLRYLLL